MFGKNSFAGQHDPNDEMDVILFDVLLPKKGFVHPKDFIKNFGHLDIPKLIYEGNFNKSFMKDVEDNVFNLKEGVVVKGVERDRVWMSKVKTKDWYNKLKNLYGEENYQKELKNIF